MHAQILLRQPSEQSNIPSFLLVLPVFFSVFYGSGPKMPQGPAMEGQSSLPHHRISGMDYGNLQYVLGSKPISNSASSNFFWVCLEIVYLRIHSIIGNLPIKVAIYRGLPHFKTHPYNDPIGSLTPGHIQSKCLLNFGGAPFRRCPWSRRSPCEPRVIMPSLIMISDSWRMKDMYMHVYLYIYIICKEMYTIS